MIGNHTMSILRNMSFKGARSKHDRAGGSELRSAVLEIQNGGPENQIKTGQLT